MHQIELTLVQHGDVTRMGCNVTALGDMRVP